jgi:hypothetical protein
MAFVKDPGESKRYGRDWTDHLEDGDSVAVSEWVIEDGLTASGEELVGAIAVIRLSGGTSGEDYDVTNHVTTTQGDEFERTFTVAVRDL